MKKVLVISSSPRKGGNSDLLCDEFMRGAVESGNEAEKIFLADHKIAYCCGCNSCYGDGSSRKPCAIKDDMAMILDKMEKADVIVLATPVYFYSMSGQLKVMIDRTVPKYNDLIDKEFYYILTAADGEKSSLDRTIEGLRGFTEDCLPGAKERGIVYGVGAWHKGEIKETSAMAEAYAMGKRV